MDSSWHVWSGKADAISEKERRRRDFELACVEGRRTPSARRSGEAVDSSWHVWSGKAEANSEKKRRSRGFELAWKKPPAFGGRLCL